ncbi:hypothetical protein [Wolbachia endosymbiont of Madathamugadia hiepei]|uniref:hypothetical protein n=1 Tax=Wolbachia endosymbiont of Madathamugadia hiepei TaxID=1241303 RepID=UPI00158996AF|nr:hypothetical protein [Wolbachia endosymbiont of Madathamugadia hiepei]
MGDISKFVICPICFPNNEGWYYNSVCGMPLTKDAFSGSCISLSLLCTLLQAHTSGVIINAAAQNANYGLANKERAGNRGLFELHGI